MASINKMELNIRTVNNFESDLDKLIAKIKG
jgi:hypothetical protein